MTEAAQPGQQKLQGLLLGLLVVGGLIALGLGAAVALLSRGGTGEQVVVVGDEDPVAQPPVAIPPAAPPLTSTTPSVALTQTVEVGVGTQTTPERGETPESRIGASPRSSATPSAEDRQARLSRAVQQQSGQFQSCFAQHLEGENIAPEAVLHFSVAKEGGRAQVQVEPPALASTPLGGCLEAAAVRVQFPELDQPVSFRLPVRARITHSKGPG